jgi:putative spermidine/putrescine transport system permease protein
LLLAPVAALLVTLFLAPIGVMFQMSFYEFVPGGLAQPALILDNYAKMLSDSFYQVALFRTLYLGAVVTFCCLLLSYPLAYTIARSRSRWAGLLLIVVLTPLMTSVVARTYGWTVILAGGGPIDSVVGMFGLSPMHLLFSLNGIIVALIEVLMPFMVLSLLASLQHLDINLELAASNLGAPPWRVFRDVVLPLSLPGIVAGSVLVFVQAVSAFATPELIGGPTTTVMSTTVYDQAISALNWPFASAISFVLLGLTLALIVLQDRLVRFAHR